MAGRMPTVEAVPQLGELPEPPLHEFVLVEDLSGPPVGFLRRISRRLRVLGQSGLAGEAFVYDEVDRRALDAVVVAPYFTAPGPDGASQVFVILRSALRPPVALRTAERSPRPEPSNRALWELPAGLVEPDESSEAGLFAAARRELLEETGFRAEGAALQELGPSCFPCPGVIAERHFYFRAEVKPEEREEPGLDGSPLEAIGALVAVPLGVALAAARAGRLADAKTELCLRRLQESLA
jgi:ADP-ribose pyrophosphatase